MEKYKFDLNKLISEEVSGVFKQHFFTKDDLLSGITFEDLITAVHSNEQEINEVSVKKTFEDMAKANLLDSKTLLKSNMKYILKELKKSNLKEIDLTEKTDDELEQAIKDNIIPAADKDYENWIGHPSKFKWELSGGNKFIKIIRNDGGGKSVWGFVALDDGIFKGIPYVKGDVFKAASWNAPAKHKRGSVFVAQDWKWTGPDYLR